MTPYLRFPAAVLSSLPVCLLLMPMRKKTYKIKMASSRGAYSLLRRVRRYKLPYAVIISAAFLCQGVLLESLLTKRFDPDKKRMEHLAFLNVAQTFVSVILSLIMSNMWSPYPPPFRSYWLAATANTICLALWIEAFKYISYPAQVLAKSSKLNPVMLLLGPIVYGVRYTFRECLCTFLVAGGVSVFALSETSSETISKLAHPNALHGYLLCFLYVLCDGFTNARQDEISKRYPTTNAWDTMAGMNVFGLVYSTLYAVLSPNAGGEETVQFCQQHPEVAWYILSYGVCGAVGQIFILLTTSKFGSSTSTAITTSCNFVSIVVSSLLSGNPLSRWQWGCVFLVFGALGYQIYHDWKESQRMLKLQKMLEKKKST